MYPKLACSGFIYGYTSDDPGAEPFLLRIGNIPNRGQEFINIHVGLAVMSTELDSGPDINREIISQTPQTSEGESSTSLADKLAFSLMSTPLELLPEQVQHALDSYIASRKPEE